MSQSSQPRAVKLLRDQPHLIPNVGELRWREWGYEPEPVTREWWVATTRREAGREQLPVTWVAVSARGEALGAVGLADFDIEERRNRGPWVIGMIVRPESRGLGVGRRLLSHLEACAGRRGFRQLWVGTGGPVVGLYQQCGWLLVEVIVRSAGKSTSILSKATVGEHANSQR